MCVSPMSTPITSPKSGRTSNSARGRPPSESSEPAPRTMPSAISSETTLLTVAELSPEARVSSTRLAPCWW
jgi:hypothetical protein